MFSLIKFDEVQKSDCDSLAILFYWVGGNWNAIGRKRYNQTMEEI